MITFLFFIAYSTTPILSAPAQSEAHLDLIRDVQGRYKFTLTSSNVTRIQESFLNGSVKGSYSYLTSNKQRQTILYKTGFDGLTIEGKYLPGALGQEPEDLPEVLEAKRQFSIVSENVKKYFTVYGGDKPVVDLSTEGFLNVVSKQLDPGLKPVYSPKDGRI